MSRRGFVHLHTHTELSLFDGCGKQADFIRRAKQLGCGAIGLTEHGSMRGVLRQRATCLELGLKPIYGIEFYLAEDMSQKGLDAEEEARIRSAVKGIKAKNEAVYQEEVRLGMRDRFHLTVLAKNDEGLRNLFRLSSMAWIRGMHKKPRIDWAALEAHREGLIVLSGCLSGPVAKSILNGKFIEALERVEQLQAWFGDDFYLEVMPHQLANQVKANKGLVRIARSLRVPLVATQDAHWVCPGDRKAQDAMLCIHTRDVLSNPERFKFETDDFYLKSRAEMESAFSSFHGYFSADEMRQALDATIDISEKVTAQIQTDRFAALLPTPLEDGVDEFAYLQRLALDGWERCNIPRRAAELAEHRGESETGMYDRYVQRLCHELTTIRQKKIVRYFLVIWDVYQHAHRRGIEVGPGRGSAASSLVLFLLGVTDLDPIEHGLLFERFVAPGRVDLPDVDCDFESRRRDDILDYLRVKYGDDRTAQIATINTMAGKGCLRDLGRILEIPIGEINDISNAILAKKKGDERVNATIEDAFTESKVCQEFNARHPEVLELAKKLEGQARALGVHAAGIVVSPVPLADVCPLETRAAKDKHASPVVVTAVDMRDVQELGLLKIDILAVRNLDAIKDCVEAIERRHQKKIDLSSIDLNDRRVLANFTKLEFSGIFQFDTHAARSLCDGIEFESFEDVVTMVALDRPGTGQSGLAAEFVKRKKDPKARVSVHPIIDAICSDSLGVIVYQEHVIRIAREFAGYSAEDADKLRRLIAKSYGKESIAKERGKFIAGAVVNGHPEKLAKTLIDQIAHFGGYGFNKSHAAAYGLTAYRQMFLKTYYPVEFMWSLLCHEPDTDHKARLVRETRRMGLEVKAPDVNTAGTTWTIDGEAIVGALSDLKGVGPSAIQSISGARPFKSFVDFARRVERRRVNRKVVDVLLRGGALSSLVPNVRWLNENLDPIWDLVVTGRWTEVTRHLIKSAELPDWTPEEAEAVSRAVNPLSEDRSLETHQEWIEQLPVTWTALGADELWELTGAFVYGRVDEVKVGRGQKGALGEVAEYAYVVIEDSAGKRLRLRVEGDILGLIKTTQPGSVIAAHVGVNPKYKSLRVHYVVDLLDLRRKLSAGEELTTWEAVFTEAHPVSRFSSRDLGELAAQQNTGYITATGLVTHVHRKLDKNKRVMSFMGLQGVRGYLDILAFSSVWADLDGKVQPGQVIRAQLRRDGRSNFLECVSDFLS